MQRQYYWKSWVALMVRQYTSQMSGFTLKPYSSRFQTAFFHFIFIQQLYMSTRWGKLCLDHIHTLYEKGNRHQTLWIASSFCHFQGAMRPSKLSPSAGEHLRLDSPVLGTIKQHTQSPTSSYWTAVNFLRTSQWESFQANTSAERN